MNKFLHKLFLLMAHIFLLLVACATPPTPPYILTGDRVQFPYYGLSVKRPPENYEMIRDTGHGQIVVWVDFAAGTSFGILTWESMKDLSYHDVVANFAQNAHNRFLAKFPGAFYEISAESEEYFGKRKFYRALIVHHNVTNNGEVTALLYVHKTSDFVYFFVFMNEPRGLEPKDMMESVTFSERVGIEQAAETGKSTQTAILPETLFKLRGFSVRSPSSEGWVLIEKRDTQISFGKPTSKGAYHTIRAKVSTIRNKIFLSTKELKTFIETDVRDNLPSRHRNVTLRTSIERVHGVECVSYDIEMEDHAVPDAPGKVFDMTVTGHFCPHPDFPESYVIDIQYSQRFLKGEKPLPNESERDSFINSLGFMQLD